MSKPVRIGITAGDLNGIGLETALKSLYGTGWPNDQRAVLIGSRPVIRQQCKKLRLPVPPAWSPEDHPAPKEPVSVWDPCDVTPAWKPGTIRADASLAAYAWIKAAAAACMDGRLDAMVTAPICKEGFHKAGINVPGHTELLAQLTRTKKFAMMLFGGPLRVVLATRHIPIADVPKLITKKLIAESVIMTAGALAWMGLKRKRIAVCGLNPHAGEGGSIGLEDKFIISPAVKNLKRKGLDVHGPLPADTVFHYAATGAYDAVIAMYHDQGLAPLKLIAFDSGVNLTLGLPIVRTSPDHGTAFDIAGKNKANPSSMTEAIVQARKLALRKNPWRIG